MADRPTAVRCSGVRAGTPHGPHNWTAQPGMDPVRCPGTDDHPTADPESAQADRWHRREPLAHLLSRAARGVLTPKEGPLLRAAVDTELADAEDAHRRAEQRDTYRAAWHSARDRARQHRAAVDDMWDANTRLAARARRAEQQAAQVRSTLADRIQRAYPDDFGAGVIADHIRGITAWPDEDTAGQPDTGEERHVEGVRIPLPGVSECGPDCPCRRAPSR